MTLCTSSLLLKLSTKLTESPADTLSGAEMYR
uniref:Uncharacterized protein n=1 Tax=Anguilla anguilla TaxID=7936 RepID=A0A0E9RWK7_ANGAN